MMKCPECNGSIERRIEGLSEILICNNCGWSVATSREDALYEDQSEYTLTIIVGNSGTKDILKAISEITGNNYIVSQKVINDAPTDILRAKAPTVKEAVKKLDVAGVKYEITPKFTY